MELHNQLIGQFEHRLFNESIPRIFKCLDLISEEQVWQRPTPEQASIGHLILHLNGNVRQWILSGLLGDSDDRNRDWEFQTDEKQSISSLKSLLKDLEQDLRERISDFKNLEGDRQVQGFNETGVSIIVHVIEHFSYHTGQIAQFTRILTNQDLGFYAGLDLNAKS